MGIAPKILFASMSPMILDSRKLLAFATLARAYSFTQAARELSLTQSAVSHAIKALEKDLGVRLFERMGRKVTITPAGQQLLQHTEVILAEMKHARADLVAFAR
jgi:DNA-binding transcriptional LysR family regulator